ncbi:MAG: organic solvent tolerance protein OstA, partial [Pirellulales bacterium]
ASPSTEIVDDLSAVRMGMRHRWQTKRGRPGARRTIDWVTFDTRGVWFPNADRDNFGENVGLVDYDLRWHAGDRVTLVSDGAFDFFTDGLKTVSVGGFLTRPPRGSLYLGLRSYSGPISSNVLNSSFGYWMSPKWVSTFGASIDLGSNGTTGGSIGLTRIGESLLVTLGFNIDTSKNTIGVNFLIEPRFLPKTRLSRTPGLEIPAAGAFGLE